MKYNNCILFILICYLVAYNSCSRGVNVDLGNNYRLITSARAPDLVIVKQSNIEVIMAHIVTYSFDSNFIVAAQRPRDSIPGLKTMKYDEYEKAFTKSSFKQYWIIDKRKTSNFNQETRHYSNVYGPFKDEQFLTYCVQIGVPKKITLEVNNNVHTQQ